MERMSMEVIETKNKFYQLSARNRKRIYAEKD